MVVIVDFFAGRKWKVLFGGMQTLQSKLLTR